MKVMIIQPMQGKTAQEIVEKRDAAAAHLELMGYEVVNNLFTDEWYSPEKMAERGCRIEHEAAVTYGLTILCEGADE